MDNKKQAQPFVFIFIIPFLIFFFEELKWKMFLNSYFALDETSLTLNMYVSFFLYFYCCLLYLFKFKLIDIRTEIEVFLVFFSIAIAEQNFSTIFHNSRKREISTLKRYTLILYILFSSIRWQRKDFIKI